MSMVIKHLLIKILSLSWYLFISNKGGWVGMGVVEEFQNPS